MGVPARAIDAGRDDAIAPLARRERRSDVEVAVEAVALVEADLLEHVAARGRAVALHRVDVARGRLVVMLEVRRAESPGAGEADAAVRERRREDGEEIAGELHRRVELQDEAAAREAEECVPGGALAKIAVREDRGDPRIPRGELDEAVLRIGARARVEHDDLAVARKVREHGPQAAGEVVRPVPRDDRDAPGAGRGPGCAIGELLGGRDRAARARRHATIGARHDRAVLGLVIDPVAVEGRAKPVRAAVVTGHARRDVLLDAREDLSRRLRVLARDAREVQAEDPVGLEHDLELRALGDLRIGGALVQPGERLGQVEVVGERLAEPLEPALVAPIRKLAVRELRPVPYALAEVVERLGGLSQRAEREVHPRPVMREQALIAEGERIDAELDHLVDGEGVLRRLRHLHAVGKEMLPVHPVADDRMAERPLGLRDLVLVVREDVVDTARVKIEALAEVLRAHRRTLDVPAREARAPWRVPHEGAPGLALLPEREVGGVALLRVDLDAHASFERFADVARQLPVAEAGERAAEPVGEEVRAEVPEVDGAVHRRPAGVHADLARALRAERDDLALQRVVDAELHQLPLCDRVRRLNGGRMRPYSFSSQARFARRGPCSFSSQGRAPAPPGYGCVQGGGAARWPRIRSTIPTASVRVARSAGVRARTRRSSVSTRIARPRESARRPLAVARTRTTRPSRGSLGG